jgi:hypothetical protein
LVSLTWRLIGEPPNNPYGRPIKCAIIDGLIEYLFGLAHSFLAIAFGAVDTEEFLRKVQITAHGCRDYRNFPYNCSGKSMVAIDYHPSHIAPEHWDSNIDVYRVRPSI